MSFIMSLVWDVVQCALCVWIGLVIGQWANLPTSEWDKVDAMTWRGAIAKMFRWSYWSIKRFIRKSLRLYPFDD